MAGGGHSGEQIDRSGSLTHQTDGEQRIQKLVAQARRQELTVRQSVSIVKPCRNHQEAV